MKQTCDQKLQRQTKETKANSSPSKNPPINETNTHHISKVDEIPHANSLEEMSTHYCIPKPFDLQSTSHSIPPQRQLANTWHRFAYSHYPHSR